MEPFFTPSVRLVTFEVADAGPFRVLIVSDDPLARAGLAALLADAPWHHVAGTAGSLEQAAALLDASPADVVLWDLGRAPASLPPGLSEIDLPVVALLPDEATAAAAWASGARALLLRDAAPDALAAALVAAARGLVVLDPALADPALLRRDEGPEAEPLTAREAEVLQLLARGLPNKLIADILGISENTVKYHVAAILEKLGVHSRTEAVVRAARLGLVII